MTKSRLYGSRVRDHAVHLGLNVNSSAHNCGCVVEYYLYTHFGMYPTISADAALQVWSQGHSEPPPNPPDAAKQRVWDSVKVKASYRSLLEGASTEQDKARLLALACPESGAWLMAAPISALGLRMDDVIQVAAGLRLGLPLCRPHTCASCKVEVDELGIHGLSCHFSKGRHSLHASLNNVIKRALE